MNKLKTKSNTEVDVISRIDVNGRPHFIVPLQNPKYIINSEMLTRYVLVPITEFNIGNGFPNVEFAQKQ